MSFFVSIIVFAVSVFLLAVSARYGLIGAGKLDDYFSQKTNSDYDGFQLYYRIPTWVGVIPEYFYAMVLGHNSYFRKNWWALKTSSFLSVIIFIVTLGNRSAVYSYYSFEFVNTNGINALFTSGSTIMALNIITLLYLVLFAFICVESVKMHGSWAPIRIAYYSLLCLIMANLTIITLSIIIFLTLAYLAIKLIWFLFFSSRKSRRRRNEDEEDEETAGTILAGGFREFKSDLYDWESEEDNQPSISVKPKKRVKVVRKKPRITRRRKRKVSDDEIPRVHPD